jgi:hypothetical protein
VSSVQGAIDTQCGSVEDPVVTPMRVIDAVVSHLYDARGVRVLGDDGLVHRLLQYHEGTVFTQGWLARCDHHYGDAGNRLETFDPITCVMCASGR